MASLTIDPIMTETEIDRIVLAELERVTNATHNLGIGYIHRQTIINVRKHEGIGLLASQKSLARLCVTGYKG